MKLYRTSSFEALTEIMAKNYTADELNNLSKEFMIALVLAMQAQMETLNANMERLIEQIAVANNQRYGRSSEKMEVIDGQLSLDFIFNEAEALTETLYVVEPTEEDMIPTKKKKQVGKREEALKDLPIEIIEHKLSEQELVDIFGKNGWKQLPDEVFKLPKLRYAHFVYINIPGGLLIQLMEQKQVQ